MATDTSRREPLVLDRCPSKLWEGVSCALPAGHKGSHQRPATPESAAMSWRSSTPRLVR